MNTMKLAKFAVCFLSGMTCVIIGQFPIKEAAIAVALIGFATGVAMTAWSND